VAWNIFFPQPTDEELGKIYGNYYNAWGLDKNAALTEQMKKATFARILGLVSSTLPPRGKILDLGCASGFFLTVAQDKGLDPYGVELSDYGAQKCIERFGTSHIFHGEVENAQFAAHPSKKFDAVFMTDYIEHVRDPLAVLETAREMLTENGCVVLTTPESGR